MGLRIELDTREVGPHHWASAPRVYHGAELVLDLWGTAWDLTGSRDEGPVVELALRCFPGDTPGVTLWLDLGARRAGIGSRKGSAHPLAEARAILEREQLRRLVRRARDQAPTHLREATPRQAILAGLGSLERALAGREPPPPSAPSLRALYARDGTVDEGYAYLLARIDDAAERWLPKP